MGVGFLRNFFCSHNEYLGKSSFCCSLSFVVDVFFSAKDVLIYMREDLAKLGGGGRVFMSNSLQTIIFIFFYTKQITDVP